MKLGATDMRKSFTTLGAIVQESMKLNLFGKNIFIFCNKRKRLLKILYWERNGFCLWMKRLESDKFKWPKRPEDVIEITPEQLTWFLNGLDFSKAYKPLSFKKIC